MLGWVTKLLGLAFALAKTILILALISMLFQSVITTFQITQPAIVTESVLYPYLKDISDTVFPFIQYMFS